MKRFIILISILSIPIILLALFITGVIKPKVTAPKRVTLTMWVTKADPSAYTAVLKDYNAIRPYISISIERVSSEDYATRLKDAWARGKGPDIFELPSSWVGEFANDFLLPVPKTTNVYTYTTRKVMFRSETEIKKTPITSITIPQLKTAFADVVAEDVIKDQKIYGLPLSLDTLVLYYNKDLLRSANIAEPPKTWSQLASLTPRLSIADEDGKLLQSGIALGRGGNVDHSADIISLLFLQDGVTMNGLEGRVLLDESLSDKTNLGVNAVTFYTSFANTSKAVYSWNADQPRSIQAFMRGKTVLFFGYNSDRATIEEQSSINLGVSPMLHLDPDGKDALMSSGGNPLQVNYGNYQVLSVFQRTKNPQEAWNFLQYVTKQETEALKYLKVTRGVGALRSILTKQAEDPEIGVQAQQAISARSWYRGNNAGKTEAALSDMLDNVADGKASVLDALSLARKQIELTTRKK